MNEETAGTGRADGSTLPRPRLNALRIAATSGLMTVLLLGLVRAIWQGSHDLVAETWPPGTYWGTYYVDRWGQGRLGYLFVSPKLEKTLSPYLGLPVSVEATAIDQPTNPGGAMITRVGTIERLRASVRVQLAWDEPEKGPVAALRRIRAGERVRFRVTLTNRSGGEIPRGGEEIRLNVGFHHPSGAGHTDPMEYWAQHSSYSPLGPRELEYSACEESTRIGPRDQELDARGMADAGPSLAHIAPLPDGASWSWTVALKNLPANEYEITVVHAQYQAQEQKYIEVMSNRLRLDVTTGRPLAWQGLQVGLRSEGTEAMAKGGSVPLQVRLANTARAPLRFCLWKAGGRADPSSAVLCYDRSGTLLPMPIPEDRMDVEEVRLAAGEARVFDVRAPAGTVLARVAFYHRYLIQDAPKGETPLDTGYAFSPHLLIERPEPRGDAGSRAPVAIPSK